MVPDIYRFLFLIAITLLSIMAPIGKPARGQMSQIQYDHESKSYSVLTLKDIIDLALSTNRGVIGSGYRLETQRYSLNAAKSEFDWKFIPGAEALAMDNTRRLGWGLTVEKKQTFGSITQLRSGITSHYDSDEQDPYRGEFDIAITLPLLRGFGKKVALSGVYSAKYGLRTSKRSHLLTKAATVLEVVSTVYDIVKQRELVRLYQFQTDNFSNHALFAAAKEKIGLATPLDVYRAKIRLKDAEDKVVSAQEALRSAGDRLKILLASPWRSFLHVEAPLDCLSLDITLDQAVKTALQHRVELKQAQDDLKEARRLANLAKNNLLPQVDIITRYSRFQNAASYHDTMELRENIWSINLTGSTDVLRKAEKIAFQQSLLTIKRLTLSYDAIVDNIEHEVRQYYALIKKSKDSMDIRKEQIEDAKGKLALSKIKFEHGMANNFDVIEAETELQEAQSNFLAAKIDYIVGRYRLRAAMGTLLEAG